MYQMEYIDCIYLANTLVSILSDKIYVNALMQIYCTLTAVKTTIFR